jgi:hypothetical protein
MFALHRDRGRVSAGHDCYAWRVHGYVTHAQFAMHSGAMRIGYARVSTGDQHLQAQQDALRVAGCERVFSDTASGKLARHPELDKAHLVAPHGDQLVITKRGRLGLLGAPRRLVQPAPGRGVHLVVLDQEAVPSPLSPNRHPIVAGLPHVLGPAAANRGCALVCRTHLLSDLSIFKRCRGSRCRGSQHSSSRTKREQSAGEA